MAAEVSQTLELERATAAHLPQIRRFLQQVRRRHVDFGTEDLPGLVDRAHFWLAQEGERLVGLLCVQVETRPTTLPPTAPTRGYVRAAAVAHGYSPAPLLAALLQRVEGELRAAGNVPAYQLMAYGSAPWLLAGLLAGDFTQVDSIQFYQLTSLQRRPLPEPPPQVAQLAPAHAEQMADLAVLDAAAFEPLWHFSRQDLLELLMRSRLQVALYQGELAGYSALSSNSEREMQLARLAVHPRFQGQGIGRQLLWDSIAHARQSGCHVLALNTQTSNRRSQDLYRRSGFQAVGTAIPVLVRLVR